MNPRLGMSASRTLPDPVPPRPTAGDVLMTICLNYLTIRAIIQYISLRDMSKGWLSTLQAAKRLGVSEASVRRWSDRGLIPVQRVGKRLERRFKPEHVDRFAVPSRPGPPFASDQSRVTLCGQVVTPGSLPASLYESVAA